MSEIELEATLTCPECHTKHKVIMPLEEKQHYFKCSNEACGADISTNEDECCVFCSHSDKNCPIKQANPNDNQKPKLQSLI